MSSEQVVAIIIAVIAAVGTSLVTGILARPRTRAEARATDASGEVSVSGDAREWARDFAVRADKAEERANVAERRADAASERADLASRRCDDLERKIDLLVDYTGVLQRAITEATGRPAPRPPRALIPPLSHPGSATA